MHYNYVGQIRNWNDSGIRVGCQEQIKTLCLLYIAIHRRNGSSDADDILNGKNITHIRKGINGAGGTDATQMHFFYDAQGSVATVGYNGVDYAYLHNLQGDVVGLMVMSGSVVVEYGYDAWGAPISTEGSMAATLGRDNPFRYRGYVWDEETGLYYLRSRYYDPSWGRFVNADTLLSRGDSRLFDHNAFCYCHQNPVNRSDSEGNTDIAATLQQNVQVAFPTLAPLTVNPIAAFFLVLLWPAPTANSDALTIPCYDSAVAIPRSGEKVKTKTQTLDAAPALPDRENDLVIYRRGGSNPGNLVPRQKDLDEGDGLSFSIKPIPNSIVTTIGKVNATGILVAIHDRPWHVSVKPTNATLQMWKDSGVTSIWTLALKAIVSKYRGL